MHVTNMTAHIGWEEKFLSFFHFRFYTSSRQNHKNVDRVIYPTLYKGEIGARAKKYFNGGNGALVGMEVKGGTDGGKKFINSL